jgi:prepilin-type N-terminal cleavage/methylation domain-containing protein
VKHQKGFTLVEAAVAIAVVAILSGIIIPLVLKSINDSQAARAKNDIQVIVAAVASQLKDTASRPKANNGPGGASGTGQAIWYSGGAIPLTAAPAAGLALPAGGALVDLDAAIAPQSFRNLFSSAAADLNEANHMFGLDNQPAGSEWGYKGPYLAPDVCAKSDPWGRAYVILGYNHDSEVSHGPIWVVSAGPSGTVSQVSLVVTNGAYPAQWNFEGVAAGNLAVRVN